jgi:hypothetical protein
MSNQRRQYTALQDGAVVGRGTFNELELLQRDYPAAEYELLLDTYLEFDQPVPTYAELRRMAYPPLADFADATYWQSQGDNTKMEAYLAKIEAVKLMYPKPE